MPAVKTKETRAALSQGRPRDAASCTFQCVSTIEFYNGIAVFLPQLKLHSTLILTAVTSNTAIVENHGTRQVKATMIVYMWLFYSAKKCYNNWSQLRSLTLLAKHSISSVTHSLRNVCLHRLSRIQIIRYHEFELVISGMHFMIS